ncbi:hypothetical protein FRC07_009241, partial [Ceratobasidium sp. 392]
MSYTYKAASTSRAQPSRQATSLSGSTARAYPASAPSVAVTVEDESAYTRDRWAAAQFPTVQMAGGSRSGRGVRFAEQEGSSAYLQPHGRHRRADSPTSQASSVPSLSHSADFEHDDDLKCPPTPEFKPVELAAEGSSKPRSSKRQTAALPPAHVAAYSTIGQINYELDAYVVAFEYPRDLDFEAPIPGTNAVPTLAYTAKNRPLLEHIQNLEKLQNELDGIESYGDHGIRKARKDVVMKVERELDGLRRIQARIWKK